MLNTQSYHANTGKFQSEFNKYSTALSTEFANTPAGIALEAAILLYHDYYNNNNCNAREYQYKFYLDIEYEELNISPEFQCAFNIIASFTNNTDIVSSISELIRNDYYIESTANALYESMMDSVLQSIINSNL